MKNYNAIRKAMREVLNIGFEHSNGQYTDFFALCVEQKWIDIEELELEIKEALACDNTDWVGLAIEENLLWPPREEYLDEDVINYFKVLTWDVFYPEKHLTESEVELLRYDTLCVLRDAAQVGEGEGWMSVEEIIRRLSGKRKRWRVLEPYHFFLGILDIGIPYYDQNVEQIKKRPLDLGRFRITPKGVNYLESTLTKWIQGRHPDA